MIYSIKKLPFRQLTDFCILLFPLCLCGGSIPPKTVSLVPSVTEIVYALGGENALVGVVDPEGYPEDIDKPIVGRFSSPNFERIYALSPDIVFVESGEQERFQKPLESLGIEVIIITPKSIDEIFGAIIEVGNIIGKEDEALTLVDSLKNELEKIRKLANVRKEKRTVFFELSENPLITIGKRSFINELIDEAGGINITSDIDSPYPVISQELVVNSNPDVIIIAHDNGTDPKTRIGWKEIEAVKNGRIIEDVDLNLLLRPGPRVIEGIKTMTYAIYGEL
ncbi:MAG: cobalamin-binding protein [bacterium (Candidatus Stahlbacteria) CG08_land_8_20_14_0_20_40_26]|nr:MAG: cobalamin-binding protein [bacterium (Candidatus Stahlbacteria) CG23_combo_of_CG06-09_8_20_14_all_40_9]PIS26807.1 MAG: cobalamin-binding protein [bacterium (Candidatus Stahlbacteria) CG08_land_8_20_14_0_20_40_26]